VSVAALGCAGGSDPPARVEPSRAQEARERDMAVVARLQRERRRLQAALATDRARAGQASRARPEPTTGRASLFTAADRASFDRLAARRGGQQGLAVSLLGRGRPVERLGALRDGVAWSTAKVPIAAAVLAAGEGPAHAADLEQAITASDNAAALRLWDALGGGAAAGAKATRQLRLAGDERTVIETRPLRGAAYTPFGQTDWALSDQARFMAGLECSSAGRAVTDLMRRVVPGQRWGLGSLPGDVAFKGGWGPGSRPGVAGGYLDRQMGVVRVRGVAVAVAMASVPAAGTHEAGISDLDALARWLPAHLRVPRTANSHC
jgi:hypothetical protein